MSTGPIESEGQKMTSRRAPVSHIHDLERRSTIKVASIPALTLAVLVAAGVPCSAGEDGGLTVRPDGDKVIVEGVQPFSQVVLLGVIRVVVGTIPGFERWVGTASDLDGDGSLTVTLEDEVRPDRSVWIVVDTKNMAWAMSQPVVGGSPLTMPAESSLASGSTDWLIQMGKVEVLAVRPGDFVAPGIWAGAVWDGGPDDIDGIHNGSVKVQARRLEEVPGSSGPAPESFQNGDLIVAFGPESFQSFVARVAEGGGR